MRLVKKRRIRFLTDAKIVVFFVYDVVVFVVFVVVLRVVATSEAVFEKLRNWVISVPSPWVTTQKSAHRKVKTLERSVFTEGLKGVLRACWSESACRWFEWRDADLIEPYQENERRYGDLLKSRSELAHFLSISRSDDLSFL